MMEVGATDRSIQVEDISGLPLNGLMQLGDEVVSYSGKRPIGGASGNTGGAAAQRGELLNVRRGLNGTVAAAHTAGTNLALMAELPTPSCLGDCNGDAIVKVDELVGGVNIALGSALVGECPAFDGNVDTIVKVDELVTGVNHALAGCTP